VTADAFERCVAAGGVAVFPTDTVYGLGCDPSNPAAVERLYALKQRPLEKPSAVMFFELGVALESLPSLGPDTRAALTRLLPGAVSLLLPNPDRQFPLACGSDVGTLGLRVPRVEATPLAAVSRPILQSSANLAGGLDPRRLSEVPESIRAAADLVLDGGRLPGTPSTVVDLRHYEEGRSWSVIRAGAVDEQALAAALESQFHFDPDTYLELIRTDVPGYDRLQVEVAAASWRDAPAASELLELGVGTGETALRVLERHPGARLTGLDESARMLEAARAVLDPGRTELRVARLQDPLPPGPFDLVFSALAAHHLDGPGKADLFRRVRAVLGAGGVFVLGDVILPARPEDRVTPLTPGYDRPSPLPELLESLAEAGFEATVAWLERDLAVIRGVPRG
jgi:tRNA threonylcarbamoyl adenosine modification protein (Sua5/YciO/YrdC/YwlC family)